MRTLVDIPDDDVEQLDRIAAGQKRSRASVIREALRQYLASHADDANWIERGYGYWVDQHRPGDQAR